MSYWHYYTFYTLHTCGRATDNFNEMQWRGSWSWSAFFFLNHFEKKCQFTKPWRIIYFFYNFYKILGSFFHKSIICLLLNNKRNAAQRIKFLFITHCEKGNKHFLHSPQCFQTASFVRVVQTKDCLVNSPSNKPLFLLVYLPSLSKTWWEKEKLLFAGIFSFSHSAFLPIWRTFGNFHQIKNCCLQTLSIWKSVKFFLWECVKC